jgi:hypothetical protein
MLNNANKAMCDIYGVYGVYGVYGKEAKMRAKGIRLHPFVMLTSSETSMRDRTLGETGEKGESHNYYYVN